MAVHSWNSSTWYKVHQTWRSTPGTLVLGKGEQEEPSSFCVILLSGGQHGLLETQSQNKLNQQQNFRTKAQNNTNLGPM